ASGLAERGVLQMRVGKVQRFDLVTNERVRPVQQLLVLRVGLEIPCHFFSLLAVTGDDGRNVVTNDFVERAISENACGPMTGTLADESSGQVRQPLHVDMCG